MSPARLANPIGPRRPMPRLRGADDDIVEVTAHLESTRLLDVTDLHRLEAGSSDQPLDFLTGTLIVGGVEEDRRLR